MLRMWWARWSIWIIGCALATAVVIGNAFYQKKQFYPTVVYITKSKPSMAVMYAQALLFVVMLGKLFRKLFFGQLRAAEFEHLVERSWYAVTETCLAFTVFRDDFSPKFLALFTLLLFLKSFHWLAEERVDYMERSPVITWIFHVRVLSLLSILIAMDGYFVNVAYQSTITKGASVQLVFGFEYAILTTIVLNTVAKYVFHVIDMQNETPWENKAVFVLHTEVIIGLFKVILYVLFVMIMVRVYTLPLFALRPTYLALRAFKKAVNDVIMSRRAINNMNNLYPDVTLEELAATDNVCIICREEMTGGAKKLPCNHIFHVSCLRSWFQRQQTCPTCRLNVLRVPATTVPNPAAANAAAGLAGGPGGNFGALFGGQPQPILRAGGPILQPPQGQGQPAQGLFGMWGNIPPQWQPQQPGAPAQNDFQGQAPPPGGQHQQHQAAAGDAQNVNQGDSGAGVNGQRIQPPGPYMYGPMPSQFAFRPAAGGQASSFPFSIPPMPFIPLVPPPPPLLQTTGLSLEELRNMEGISRDNIEARLRCLRNVQILLDSAVVQMQQYSAIISNINVPHPSSSTPEEPVQSSSGVASASSSQPSSKTSPVLVTPITVVSESSSPSSSSTSSSPPSTSSLSSPPSMSDVSVSPTAKSVNGSVKESIGSSPEATLPASSSTSEQDEVRKRRLARFNPTEATGTGE